jgi:hypothetical protein
MDMFLFELCVFCSGADPNIPNERDFTPLHHSCAYGYVQLTKLLLQKGANIQSVTKEMSTPLHQVTFSHSLILSLSLSLTKHTKHTKHILSLSLLKSLIFETLLNFECLWW